MSQNIYDNSDFFEGYGKFQRSKHGLAAAPEWPYLQEMLPPIQGKKVLDLGCGYGWFSRWAAEQGAGAVLGIDLSQKMLDKAIMLTDNGLIQYQRGDIADFDLPEKQFDIVFSSLAIHYLADFERFMIRVQEHTQRGGYFIFSVEHPIMTAPSVAKWETGGDRETLWPLNNYSFEGKRERQWIGQKVIKYHRTLENYVNTTIAQGFKITKLVEWFPTKKEVEDNPTWGNDVHRPTFLLISAEAV